MPKRHPRVGNASHGVGQSLRLFELGGEGNVRLCILVLSLAPTTMPDELPGGKKVPSSSPAVSASAATHKRW